MTIIGITSKIDVVDSKSCSDCGTIKPLSEFHEGSGWGGRWSYCIDCAHLRRSSSSLYNSATKNFDIPLPEADNTPKPLRLTNEVRVEGDRAFVEMVSVWHKGVEIIFDMEDLPRLHERYSLIRISGSSGGSVLGRNRNTNEYEVVNRFIADIEEGRNATYVNGNSRDLRKSNITLSTPSESSRRASEKRLAYGLALPSEDFDFDELCLLFDGCAISSDRVDVSDIHAEHFIPISWGHGGFTLSNIYPLMSRLNRRKSNKNPFVFFREIADELSNADKRNFRKLVAYLARKNGMTVIDFEEFVYWCEANQRTLEEIQADNKRYGRKVSSAELFREYQSKLNK